MFLALYGLHVFSVVGLFSEATCEASGNGYGEASQSIQWRSLSRAVGNHILPTRGVLYDDIICTGNRAVSPSRDKVPVQSGVLLSGTYLLFSARVELLLRSPRRQMLYAIRSVCILSFEFRCVLIQRWVFLHAYSLEAKWLSWRRPHTKRCRTQHLRKSLLERASALWALRQLRNTLSARVEDTR